MTDPSEITTDMLVEHWQRQVQKLREVGVPLDRISDSMRTTSLEVEQDWFKSILDEASQRLTAIARPATVHREPDAPADVSGSGKQPPGEPEEGEPNGECHDANPQGEPDAAASGH